MIFWIIRATRSLLPPAAEDVTISTAFSGFQADCAHAVPAESAVTATATANVLRFICRFSSLGLSLKGFERLRPELALVQHVQHAEGDRDHQRRVQEPRQGRDSEVVAAEPLVEVPVGKAKDKPK